MAAFVPPIISGLTLLKQQQQAQEAEAAAESFAEKIARLYLEQIQNQENR